jgi:nucleoside-diphosphate-sugar epimerase
VTIAVTGATGFVGQALLDAAAARGIEVRALTRRPQQPRAGVQWIAGDLADAAALDRLTADSAAVIHVAGVVNAPTRAGFETGNVAGTAAVIAAMQRTGAPRLVHVSSLSALEPALSLYGASKARAEALVEDSGLDWTIVRPPAIYGPRDREMLELFRAARLGVVPMPAGGRAAVIHVGDLAGLLLALVRPGSDVTGRCFEPDDGMQGGWANAALGRAIADAARRRALVLPLPAWLMRLAARTDMALRGGNAKLTLDRVGYMTHPDWTVDPAAAVPAERWQPRIETRAGLGATADWYRAQGWL